MEEIAELVSLDEFLNNLRDLKSKYNYEGNEFTLVGGRGFANYFDKYCTHNSSVIEPVGNAVSITTGVINRKFTIDEFSFQFEYEPLVDNGMFDTVFVGGLPISSYKYKINFPNKSEVCTVLKNVKPLLSDEEWEIVKLIRNSKR